jgi:glycosyltransferase involved in cell wall biosynthesis
MVSSTVVICAYSVDRWEDLRLAVDTALTGQVAPQQLIVVIDHNDVLLARARHHFHDVVSDVEVLVLPNAHRRGLSGARNTALEHATQDIVVFLDDDASASPTWLGYLLRHYSDPAAIVEGGSSVPVWPTESGGRPGMLQAAHPHARGVLDWVIGCTFEGQPETATPVRNLMGCNMSFRRLVFDDIAPFSEDLGRIGKTPLGGEETEFCIRARHHAPAAVIMFEPAASVRHRVTPDRTRWRYLLARCYGEGLSKAVVAGLVGQDAALESEKSYVTKVLGRAFLGQCRRALRGDLSGVTGAAAIVAGLGATTLGYGRGSLHQRRAGRSADQLTTVAA